MAYVEQYTANFKNEQGQEVNVSFALNGGSVVAVQNYRVTALTISAASDEQDSYACIISRELTISLWTEDGDGISWETFVTSQHNDWKVTVTVDGETFFIGFVTPEEGSAPFQDKPYEITIKATDGLGLLKGNDLTQVNESRFKGFYTLIQYISGALKKTELDLPIRIYSSIFHTSMLNKGDSLDNDIFQEVELNARTFLRDANGFESCYDSLKILLDGWCNIEQYDGRWQVFVLSERQYLAGSLYYVDYDSDGVLIGGAIDSETYAKVGKNELVYPINETQIISSKFANREVKHIFNYVIPTDLVNNQSLQQLGSFISGLSGSGYSAYNLVDWEQYSGDPNGLSVYGGTKNAYIKLELDAFGTQSDRYYVIEADTGVATALGHEIRNENIDFFGDAGDTFTISITARCKFDQGGSDPIFYGKLALLRDGFPGTAASDWYTLNPSGSWVNNPFANFAQTSETEDLSQWATFTTDATVPANGTFFLFLGSGNVDNLNEVHVKDIKIDYVPYLRGARFSVKGDYHLRSLNNKNPDKFDKTVLVSDSPKRLIKGSTFWTNGSGTRVLLSGSWYRWPDSTNIYNFKELANLGKFNQSYRRFYRIEGDFTSLFYTDSFDTIRKPLGFHKKYRFTDMTPNRDFVLVAPLEMDLVTGNFRGVFQEVYKDSADGTSNGDVDKFDYIF